MALNEGDGCAIIAANTSVLSTVDAQNQGDGTVIIGRATGTSNDSVVGVSSGGTGVAALTVNTTNLNPAVNATSGGKGAAVVATTTAVATAPTVQAPSGSALPAVKAVGKAVPVSGAVPVAGNAAALTVQGVASFTRSGLATLAVAATSIVASIPGGLSTNSHVVATLQGAPAGTLAVQSVEPNPATGKITIHLNTTAAAGTKVAFFVFG